MNGDTLTTRREFLKRAGIAVLGAPVLLKSLPATAQDMTPVDPESDPVAKALGYHIDANKVDANKYSKRKLPEGANQFCHTCILLQAKGISIPGREGKWGKCTLFQKGYVNENGWCTSWTLAPKV